MDHARLVGGLVCSKPNEVMNRFPTAWASLAIWCPETTLQAIARFYQSLAVGEKIDISVVNAIGNYFPAVPLLAAKICSNSKQGLRILRKGLTWHPINRQLLEEYASISPQDIWLLNHIEKHDLIPPDNVINVLNSEADTGGLLNKNFLGLYKSNDYELRLTPLGGANEIGASAYVLTYAGKSLLLDCGLNPSKTGLRAYPALDHWMEHIDAVVISHGHLDHCGALPKVHCLWPRAPIFCTHGTKIFAALLFEDMLRIRQIEENRETYNDTIEKNEMESTVRSMQVLPFCEWKEVFNNCRIRFHPAGHIIGAAITEMNGINFV